MDLNLSNRGLFSFDAAKARRSLVTPAQRSVRPTSTSGPTSASSTEKAVTSSSASALTQAAEAALPVIRQLNLSYNALHIFTGGETLRGLVVLDLSHNELVQLRGQSLPPTLLRLHLSHNRLAQLPQLAQCTPHLQELEVHHNQLSAGALRDLPESLTQLNVEHNQIDSLAALSKLHHLVRLNVAHNDLEGMEVVSSLRPLLSLRHLDLRGNPLCDGLDSASNASRSQSSADGETTRGMERRPHQQPTLLRALNDAVPRLASLNGKALSQAPENRLLKNSRRSHSATEKRKEDDSRGERRSGAAKNTLSAHNSTGNDGAGERSYANRSHNAAAASARPAMEIRLMQAKVSELRRLLLAAQDAEGKARQRRTLLTENVKSTALVIDQQGAELEKLQADIARLREEEQQLRKPVAAVEESFEQVHASLLATKAKASAAAAAAAVK